MKTSKKAICITILAVMLLSTFAMLNVASATVTVDMRYNYSTEFPHDGSMRLGATYSDFNLLPRSLDCYLMRSVEYFTNSGSQGSHSLEVIQTQTQLVLGSFSSVNDFYDTLDLTGLNFNFAQAPDQWVGVHWIVGYYIQYKWADTPGVVVAETAVHYVGHDELAQNTAYTPTGGIITGSGGTSTLGNICGWQDGNEGAVYGNTGNVQGYIYGIVYAADLGKVDSTYRLMMKVNDWNGQPIYMTAYVGSVGSWAYDQGSGWYYPSSAYTCMCSPTLVNWLGATWLDFGQVPAAAFSGNSLQWIIVAKTTTNLSGILWVDSVQLVGAYGTPQ